MFKRKIFKSDEGVVGIVVAVLLIGLLATFLSIIQMQYVPEWMREKEAEHMDEVSNQFSDLKFSIDSQTFYKTQNNPITTSITLGSGELPFFVSMRSYGQLDVIEDECIITIHYRYYPDPITDPDTYTILNHPFEDIGIIKYSSNNAYLGDQTFIYESGAVITSQSEGNFISIDPFFKPDLSSGFTISFKIVDIEGTGGKISEAGYDTTSIRTDFISRVPPLITDPLPTIYLVDHITVQTKYINSWKEFFRSSLKNVGLFEGPDFTVDDSVAGQVTVNFISTGAYGLPSVTYEKFVIEAQIGAGIVK